MVNARRRAVIVLALTSLAGACGNGDGNGKGDGGGTKAGPPFTTTAVSTPPATRGLLTAVEATKGEDYTRIVFRFRDAVPGYAVDYARRPITQDGSGDEVSVDGDEVLLGRFEPSSGFDLTGEGTPTYTGSKRIAVGGFSDPVREVVQVGDFEAVLQWAVGLSGKRPFRVDATSEPRALVLDVEALD